MLMGHAPVRCTLMKYVPMRYTPTRYTPMRYTPVLSTVGNFSTDLIESLVVAETP
jgi:hypothetical protein